MATITVRSQSNADATYAGSAHAAAHRPGSADDLLRIDGQDSIARVEPVPWFAATARISHNNGTIHLVYFTANSPITVGSLAMSCGSAASAGATLARMGLYTVDGAGNLTLVARTANDPTIGQANAQTSRRSFDATGGFSTTYSLTIGQRYALALILVGTTTAGNYQGCQVTGNMTDGTAMGGPRRAGTVATQTDLPASVPIGTVASEPNPPWMALGA